MPVRTINRRGERRYVIDIPYRDSSGNRARYRRDAEVQTLAAARAEERRRLMWLAETGSPERGTVTDARASADRNGASVPVPTFEVAAKSFLAVYAPTRLKHSTTTGYEKILTGFLYRRIGTKPLDAIDATVLRALDRELVERKRGASTRRQMQCVVRSVLRHAHEAGFVERIPDLPRLPKTGGTIARAMTAEQVAQIIAASEGAARLALELAAYAGLRAGEVRALRWRDVDLASDPPHLVVRRSRCHGVEAPPKSGHERAVPLHPRLVESLRAVERALPGAYVTGPTPGEPWPENGVYRAFKRASAAAGIEGFRLHDLRHAFVTELFRGGTPAPVVLRLAGHQHLTTTQRYAHATLGELDLAVRRLSW